MTPPYVRFARGLALLLLASGAWTPLAAQTVAITDVSLVPLDSARTLPGRTVLVRDGVIEAVGASGAVAVPPEATVVDGRGRFLMPGLADMHAHLAHPETDYFAEDNRASLALMLAHGVTTARVMWGTPGLLAFVDSVRSGHVLGPDLALASPFLQGTREANSLGRVWAPERITDPAIYYVRTEADGREALRYVHAAGYDMAKVHSQTTPEAYRGIVDEARRLGIPVAGHAPFGIGLAPILTRGGQSSVEHYDPFVALAQASGAPSRTAGEWYERTLGAAQYADDERLALLAELARASGMWFTPTALVSEWYSGTQAARMDRLADPEVLRFTPEAQRADWRGYAEGWATNYETWGLDMSQQKAFALRLIRALHGRGARLLVGSDAPASWAPQGIAVHDEMALWAEAGLPPLAVLRTATLGARRYLREAGLSEATGEIAPGQPADLVLLRADPLADVSNARDIEAVLTRGRLLARADLDALLASAEATYAATPEATARPASGADSP